MQDGSKVQIFRIGSMMGGWDEVSGGSPRPREWRGWVGSMMRWKPWTSGRDTRSCRRGAFCERTFGKLLIKVRKILYGV